jgi:hypothetical protein
MLGVRNPKADLVNARQKGKPGKLWTVTLGFRVISIAVGFHFKVLSLPLLVESDPILKDVMINSTPILSPIAVR